MKTHRFKIIQWLGQERFARPRFAVVEVDRMGPILRDGPLPKATAQMRAKRLASGASARRQRLPGSPRNG